MNMRVTPHPQCLDLTLKEIGMIWQYSFNMPYFDQNYATKETRSTCVHHPSLFVTVHFGITEHGKEF